MSTSTETGRRPAGLTRRIGLGTLTGAGVTGLAAGGFTLAFSSLRDLAIASGLLPELAFIWPIIVDGFIVVATAAAFALKERGPRVTWYPWAALVVFAGISVAGNALHATDSSTRTVPVWVATIVSAVPAIALLVASHLLVVMVEHTRAPRPAPATVDLARAVELVEPVVESAQARFAASETTEPASETNAGPDDLHAWVRDRLTRGEDLTGRDVARRLGVSDRTGRRRLDELKVAHPALFAATENGVR